MKKWLYDGKSHAGTIETTALQPLKVLGTTCTTEFTQLYMGKKKNKKVKSLSLYREFQKPPYNRTNCCTQVIAILTEYDYESYKDVQVVQGEV